MTSTSARLRHLLRAAALGSAASGCASAVAVDPGDSGTTDVGAVDAHRPDLGGADTAVPDRGVFDVGADATPAGCDFVLGGLDLSACGPNGFTFASAFDPPATVDSVAVRSRSDYALSLDPNALPVVEASVGTACVNATDPMACLAALDALPFIPVLVQTPFYFPGDGTSYDFVFSAGDVVGNVGVTRSFSDVFGGVDRPVEAALLALRSNSYGQIDCSRPNAQQVAGGYDAVVMTGTSCGAGSSIVAHRIHVTTAGETTELASCTYLIGDPFCAIGRLTEGTSMPKHRRRGCVGDRLAEIAALEAAAVFAFERLAAELEALGAPTALVCRARASADDERRHASLVAREARRYGVEPTQPTVAAANRRGAFAIAMENATEGLVRETYGAAVAFYQSAHATHPRLRRLFADIAEDETRHAALSLDLARWLEGRLTVEERVSVTASRDAALAHFRTESSGPRYDEYDRELGMPRGAAADRLFDAVFPAAWVD